MKKVYIIATALSTSGGAETIHQLADLLSKNDTIEVYLYYIDKETLEVPLKFKEYDIKVTRTIMDSAENYLIVPETYTEVLSNYKKINKCILWLSLDFYLDTLPSRKTKIILENHNLPKFCFVPMFIILLLFRRISFNVYNFSKKEKILHFYNCEYVKEYLKRKGVTEDRLIYLCGPIRDEYFFAEVDLQEKENIVLYNPKKGYKYTKEIIEKCADLGYEFRPIENMTPSEIVDLMKRAKLYIDFGFFPGPERIPREACMMYCNIITSTLGSASNDYDVLVPYKYDVTRRNISEIKRTIKELVENYSEHVCEYNEYRKKISKQKKDFQEGCIRFIDIIRD